MDAEFLKELFEPFAEVTARKMFGGIGVFYRGVSIAIVVDDVLRLKADRETIPDFEAEGMAHWEYARKDGTVAVVDYWQVPERLLDDPDEFGDWARKAFEVAARADAAKPASKRKLSDL